MNTVMDTEFKYQALREHLPVDLCDQIVTELLLAGECGSLIGNRDIVAEQVIYAPLALEAQLVLQKAFVEEQVGQRLNPSFSFLWIYKKGAKLPRHTDRGSVDVVMTINLRSSSAESWPLYVEDADLGSRYFETGVGDAVILSGKKIEHWREECPLDWRLQAQLCYTYAGVKGESILFDGRDALGLGPIEDVITTPVQKMFLDIDTYPQKKEYTISD